jgi:hypothetical protein
VKTILSNKGNRSLFDRAAKYPGYGFTVNVWLHTGGPSYDAGFHYGPDRVRKPAKFASNNYRTSVGYRIRVKPKRLLEPPTETDVQINNRRVK